MFRITLLDDEAAARVLRLEGTLTADEIPLLDAALAECAGDALALDLSGLRWLDARAAARLHALRAAGAALRACSPYVERLLSAAPR